jgi:hypothetical protein
MTTQTKLALAIWVALINLVLFLGWRHVIAGSSAGFALCGLIAYALVFRIFVSFYSTDARRLKAAWKSFSELPESTSDGTRQPGGSHGSWHETDGCLPRSRVSASSSAQQNARVTGPDGIAAVSFTGRNFDHQARAVARMPNGQTLRFPVQGATRWSAVMTATDDSDRPVFRIRRVRSTGPGPEHKNRVEIVVEPGSQITTELLLALVAGYQNLDSFFDRPDS